MTSTYVIDTDDDGRWLYLYCPICSAVCQLGPFDDAACPNVDQPDHDDADGGDR